MKTVIVTGSRDWDDVITIYQALSEENPDLVVHGGCRGADKYAKDWAGYQMVECVSCPANWNKHGKAAGSIRNKEMLQSYNSDLYGVVIVLAFRKNMSKGTTNCVNLAKQMGMDVRVIDK